MGILRNNRRLLISFLAIVIIAAIAIIIINSNAKNEVIIINTKGQTFAGTEACKSCHADIYNSFVQTAHNHTSSVASKETVLGSFNKDSNTFEYSGTEKVIMKDSGNRLFQVAYLLNQEKIRQRFDVTIGSGVLGQSYLYWQDSSLFQLPVSYISPAKQWGNSPGFPNAFIFTRTITPRCLECHTTYARTLATPELGYDFDKSAVIYGVTCERCHGPAEDHVLYHEQNPNDKKAKYIINAANLNRKQQLDACAICHSGQRESFQPPFTFETGDDLTNFYATKYNKANAGSTDVHGNKYELLTSSMCFLKTNTITCSTCHNTHKQQSGDLAMFSQRCMTCHVPGQSNFCTAKNIDKEIQIANCIDCHMPKEPSNVISLILSKDQKLVSTPASVRTHLIKVYPEAYNNFISKLHNVK